MFGFHVRPSGDDRRRAHRDEVAFLGRIAGPQGRVPCRVVDLSPGGCRIQGTENLAAGAEMVLAMPGMIVRNVTIRWARQRAAGCRFDHPLTAEEMDILLEHSALARGEA
jgi:hypothetical protein